MYFYFLYVRPINGAYAYMGISFCDVVIVQRQSETLITLHTMGEKNYILYLIIVSVFSLQH